MKIEAGREDKNHSGPVVEGFGLDLVDLKLAAGHGRWILRVFIDRPGGVTIDDCSDVNELSTVAISKTRYLAATPVIFPGLDRPLVKDKDFIRFSGKKANIRTKADIEGRRNFKATIDGRGRRLEDNRRGRQTLRDTPVQHRKSEP